MVRSARLWAEQDTRGQGSVLSRDPGPGPCTRPAMKYTRLNSFAMFTLEKIIQFRKRQTLVMPHTQPCHGCHPGALRGERGGMENSTPWAWCGVWRRGSLKAHQSSPAVTESREPQTPGWQGRRGELMFSHPLSLGPPSPAPRGAGRKPSLSPTREGKEGAFSFKGKRN